MSQVDALAFATLFAVSYPAHLLADHAGQPSSWAADKGRCDHTGRIACAKHVSVVVTLQALAVGLVALLTGLALDPLAVIIALGLTGWSHYWIDRRTTATGLFAAIGKREFADLGTPRPGRNDNPSLGTGAYRMDQDWHITWLAITALVMASTGWALTVLVCLALMAMSTAILLSRHGRRLAEPTVSV